MKRSSDPSMEGLLESPEDFPGPFARSARVSRGRLIIELTVGITVIVPLSHFPGFAALPPRAFKNLEIIGSGIGIHFPAIDADISVENLFLPRDQLLFSRIPPKLIDRRYPAGWDRTRVKRVLEHYEQQADDEAVAEDEARPRHRRTP